MNMKRLARNGLKCISIVALVVSSGAMADEDAHALLDARIKEYLASPEMAPLREREATGEIYVGYGITEVDVGPENPEWAKHRALAYSKAFVDAQNKFVVNQGVEIASDTTRSLFADGSQRIPPYKKTETADQDKVRQVLRKLLAVGEGMLDDKLKEMGVDPKELETLPPKQRTTKLVDAIEKNAVKKAVGNLAGLYPFKTFEGKTASGQHAIGVVVVYSPTMKQFAHDVLNARGNIEPDPAKKGKPLLEQINKERIFADFGIRKLYDENGYPALVSFGQWSPASLSQDPRIRRQYERRAEEQAASTADAAITDFLASMANFEDASTIGSSIEQHFDIDHTGFIEEVLIKQITDTLRKNSLSRSKGLITGFQDLYTWSMKHPDYGHTLVGVVRVWSPASEKRARALKGWSPADGKGAVREGSTNSITGKTEVIDGASYMDPKDP